MTSYTTNVLTTCVAIRFLSHGSGKAMLDLSALVKIVENLVWYARNILSEMNSPCRIPANTVTEIIQQGLRVAVVRS